jgi:hypothetical protein
MQTENIFCLALLTEFWSYSVLLSAVVSAIALPHETHMLQILI